MRKELFLLLWIVSCALTVSAQTDYRPQVYGTLKVKFETCTDNGDHRFNVRNSRLGVHGYVSPNMRYAIQLELSSEGKLELLDTYVAYGIGAFEFSVGQQSYSFSTELDRGAGKNLFANRSFVGKFITQYQSSYVDGDRIRYRVKTIGSRDIGALLSYSPQESVLPVTFSLGAFNGEGINNPRWSNDVNVIAHARIGGSEGFGVAGSYYFGHTPVDTGAELVDNRPVTVDCRQRMRMWVVEARYLARNWLIESEFAQRTLKVGHNDVLTAAMIHGLYRFRLPRNVFAEHIAPVLRWDMGDNIKFVNERNDHLDSFDAHRITAGVTFGLTEKMLRSEIRLNYEQYFLSRKPTDFPVNNLLHNKFTVELIAVF